MQISPKRGEREPKDQSFLTINNELCECIICQRLNYRAITPYHIKQNHSILFPIASENDISLCQYTLNI